MKEENEIDQLFQSDLNKDYPYDDQLWKQMETILPSAKKKHPFWQFNLNSVPLFIIILACAFLQTDTIKPLYATGQFPKKPTKMPQTAHAYSKTDTTPEVLGSSSIRNNSVPLKEESVQVNDGKHKSKSTRKDNTQNHLSKQAQRVTDTKNKSLAAQLDNSKNSEFLIQAEKLQTGQYPLAHLTTSQTSKFSKPDERQQSIILMEPSGYIHEVYYYDTVQLSAKNNDKLHQLQEQLKPNYIYFEVEAYRSVALSKKLKGNNQQYIDYKINSESPLYREGLGVNIFRDVKFLSIGLGVHYNTYIERAKYSYDQEQSTFESTYDTSYQLVNRNFSSNGNSVFLIKENIEETVTENMETTAKQLNVRNEFKRLQLPVIIGFKQNIGRWTAGIQSAFVFNYLSESNGIYVQENLDNFSSFNDEKLFNTLVYSQRNQVNVGYALNEFILIGSRFSYEYDINSFTKNYDSKFRSYNLGLWLQWRP